MIQAGRIHSKDSTARGIVLETAVVLAGNNLTMLQTGSLSAATDKGTVTLGNEVNPFYAGSPWAEPETQTSAIGISHFRYQIGKEADRRIIDQNRLSSGRNLVIGQSGMVRSGGGSAIGIQLQYLILDAGTDLSLVQNGLVSGGDRVSGIVLQSSNLTAKGNLAFNQWGQLDQAGTISQTGRAAVAGIRLISHYSLINPGTPVWQSGSSAWDYTTYYLPNLKSRQAVSFTGGSAKNSWLQFSTHGSDLLLSGSNNFDFNAARVMIDLGGSRGAVPGDQGRIVSLGISGLLANNTEIDHSVTNSITANGLDLFYLGGSPMTSVRGGTLFNLGNGSFTRLTAVAGDLSISNSAMTETLGGSPLPVTLITNSSAELGLVFANPATTTVKTGLLARGDVTVGLINAAATNGANGLSFIGGSRLTTNDDLTLNGNLILAAFGSNGFGAAEAGPPATSGITSGIWVQKSISLNSKGVGTGGDRADAAKVIIPSDSELGLFNFGRITAGNGVSAVGIRLGNGLDNAQLTSGSLLTVANLGSVTVTSGNGTAVGISNSRMGLLTGTMLRVINMGAISTAVGSTAAASGILIVGGSASGARSDLLFGSRGVRGNVRDVEADLSNLSGNIQNRGVITSSHGTASGIEFNGVILKGWDRLNLISSAPVSSVSGTAYGIWLNRSQLLAGSIASATVSLQLQKGAAIETRSSSATAIGIEITASQITSRNDIKFILDDGVTIVNRGKSTAIIGVQWTATGSLSDQAIRLTAGGSPANFITVTTGGFNLVLNDNGRGMVGESGLILEQGAVQLDFIHQKGLISTTTNGGSTSLDPNDPSLNGRLVSNGHTISARGLKLYYAGQMPSVMGSVPAVQLGNGEFTHYQKYASDVYLSDSRVGLGKVYWSLNDVLANTGAVDIAGLDSSVFDSTLMLVYDTNGVLKTNWTIGDVKRNLGSLLTAKGLTKFSEGLTYGVYLKQRGLDLTVSAAPQAVGIATTGAISNGIWAGGTLTVNGINNYSYGLLAGQAIRVNDVAVTVPNSLLIWGYGNPQFSLKDVFNNASNIGIYLNHGTTTIKTTGSQSDLTILQSGNIFSTYATVVNAGIYDVANENTSLEAGRNLNIIQSSSATINGSEVRAIRLASDRYVAGGDILIAQLGTLTSRDRQGFGLYFRVRGFVENRFVARNLITLIANNQNLYLEGVATGSIHPSFAFYAPVTRINLGSGTVIQGSAGVEGYINAISNSRALNRLTFMGNAPTVYYTGGDPIAMINGASAPIPVIDTSFTGASAYAFELGGRTLDDGSVTRANRGTGTFIRLWQVDGDVTLDGDSQDWPDASSTAAKTAARVNAANFMTGISVNGTVTLNSFSATATATAGRVNNGGLSVIEASAIDITGTASFANAVQLRSQWGITQTGSGSLTTSKLSLTAGDTIDLGSATNQIASLGRVVTGSTGLVNFSLSNGLDLNLSDEILVTGAVLIDLGNHNINLTKAIRITAPRTIIKGGSYNSGGFMLSTDGGDLGLEVTTVTDGGLTRVIDLQGTGRYLLQQFSSDKTSYLYSGLIHGTTSDTDAEWRNIDDFTLRTSLPSGLVASQINGLVSAGDLTPTNLVLAGIDVTGNRNFTTSGTIGIVGDNRVLGDLTLSAAAITQSNSQSSLTVGQQVSLTATNGAINLSGINQLASISSLSAVGGGITLRNGGSLTLQLATINSGGEVKFILTRGDLILTHDLVSSGGAVTIELATGNYDNRNSDRAASDYIWDSSNQNLSLNALDYLGSKAVGAVGFKVGRSGQFSGNFTQAILVNSPFDSTKQNYFFTTDDESTWQAGKVAAGFNDEESQWLSYDILKQSQPALLLQRLAGNDGLVQWQNSTVQVTAPKKSLYFYNLNLSPASPNEKIHLSGYSLTFLGNNRFQGDVKLVSETIISQLPDSVLDVSGVLILQSGGAIDLSSSQNQLTSLGAVNSGSTVQIGNGRDLSLKGNIVSAGAITIALSQGNLILNQDIDSRGGAVLLELGSGSYDNRGESLDTQRVWTSNNQTITLNAAKYLGDQDHHQVGFKVGSAGFAGNLANNRAVVFDLTKTKFYFTSDAETYWDYYQYLAGFTASDSQWLDYDYLANNSSAPGLYTKNGEVTWGTQTGSFLPDDPRYSFVFYSVRSAKTTEQTIRASEIKFLGTNSFGGDLILQTTAGAISQADDSRLSVSGTLSLKAKTGIALETSHSNGNQIAALGTVTANGAIRINNRGNLSLKGSINSDFDNTGVNHEIAIGLSQGNLYLTQNIDSMGGNVTINIAAGGYDNSAVGESAPWLWRSHGKDMVLNSARYLGRDQDHAAIIDLGSATARFTSNLMKAPSSLDRSKRNFYFTNHDRADWQAMQEQAGFDGLDSLWFDLSDIDRLDLSRGIVASGNGVFGWNSAFKLGANHNVFFVNVDRGTVANPLVVNRVTMIGNNSFNSLSITAAGGLVISGDDNWFRATSLTLGGNSDLILGNRIQLKIGQFVTPNNRLNLKIDGDFTETSGFALNQFAGLTITAIGSGGRITIGDSNRAFTAPLTIRAENTSLSLRLVAAGDLVIDRLETGGGSAVFRVAGSLTVDNIVAGAINYQTGGFTHLSGKFATVSGRASAVDLVVDGAGTVVGNNHSDTSFTLGGRGSAILVGDIGSSGGGEISLGAAGGHTIAQDVTIATNGGPITITSGFEGGFIPSQTQTQNPGLRLSAGPGPINLSAALGSRISLGWLEISAGRIAYDSMSQLDFWYRIKSNLYGRLEVPSDQPLQLGLGR
ncbi:MAG: hypothetical protein QM523_02670 [Candidatus Pacebacteria bacterium]|nr:hypothetical protein [Candidatus Paceibacterota bacterium]